MSTFLRLSVCRVCRHYIPVRKPQRRVYRRVVEVEYEALCGDGSKCTKTRPEYREGGKDEFGFTSSL